MFRVMPDTSAQTKAVTESIRFSEDAEGWSEFFTLPVTKVTENLRSIEGLLENGSSIEGRPHEEEL